MMNSQGPLPEMVSFEVGVDWCDLRPGDRVIPGLVIGDDAETGEIVTSDCSGRVEMIGFTHDDRALMVLVSRD